MKGDIVFVTREPLLLKKIDNRINKEESCFIDKLIARIVYYRHYGIEIDNGQIIHFYCPSILKLKEAKVEKISVNEFIGKNGILEYEKLIESKLSEEEITERAKKFLGSNFGGYKIKTNNCEHFAYWCATDIKISKQKPSRTTYKSLVFMFGGLYYFFIGLNIFSEILKKNEL
jgi:hypothetical protein